MPIEIERKFLVCNDTWRCGKSGQRYCQGYVARTDDVTVRVRRAGTRAYLTVKGEAEGIVRPEFEYEIPLDDAESMLQLCARPFIEKTRYEVQFGGLTWQIDEFAGENEGLVIAEVELDYPEERVAIPPWAGEEVTHDPRFRNSRLVDEPVGGEECLDRTPVLTVDR